MAELEDDLRALVTLGAEAAGLDPARLERARRAAAWLAPREAELRARGLLAFGEKLADLHLAPELEAALEASLEADSDTDTDTDTDSD